MVENANKIKNGSQRGELTTNNFVIMSRSEHSFGIVQGPKYFLNQKGFSEDHDVQWQ
jgi:hypothetical protein